MEKNQAYTHLICAAQNMKNIAIKRTNIDEKVYDSPIFIDIFVKMTEKIKMYIKENSTFFQMRGLSTLWGVQKCTPFVCFIHFLFILICYKMKAPRENDI